MVAWHGAESEMKCEVGQSRATLYGAESEMKCETVQSEITSSRYSVALEGGPCYSVTRVARGKGDPGGPCFKFQTGWRCGTWGSMEQIDD